MNLGGLSFRDIWWITQILVMLAIYPLVNRLPLPRLVRLYDTQARRTGSASDCERLITLLQGLLRRTLERDFCLPRSLIMFRFFRRWGVAARIHVGLTKRDDEALGHAWVSVAGEPVAERNNPDEIYKTFFVYP
jgi:hypothetical protein